VEVATTQMAAYGVCNQYPMDSLANPGCSDVDCKHSMC
jgi:hypothetical protein